MLCFCKIANMSSWRSVLVWSSS